ncbi:hypothetical protein Scep_020440 [Stephania cephalantha]|uniref:Isopropylmalate dehydrogenase-like domain-containing protein n=1 Tax=Stephania cephalantha TaxID=152367 RepID=A0AAP0IDQ3_9MAGN
MLVLLLCIKKKKEKKEKKEIVSAMQRRSGKTSQQDWACWPVMWAGLARPLWAWLPKAWRLGSPGPSGSHTDQTFPRLTDPVRSTLPFLSFLTLPAFVSLRLYEAPILNETFSSRSLMASQIVRRVLRSRTIEQIATPLIANGNSFGRVFVSTPYRCISTDASPNHPIRATLFPGDGIGPEIANSVKQVFNTAEVPIEWEEHYVGDKVDPRTESFLTWESLESVRRNGVGLKGPMATPIGKGHRSLNLTLRKELGLYANVRPCYSLEGYKTRYDDVNLVTIRENTEGEYSGLEHQVVRGVVESLKVITRQASLRVAEYAFYYAKAHGRQRVSAIHKANIMRKTDGLFLKCCREVAEKYPEINYEEVIIDNCCMMLVKNPALFDVLVMPNLYGDIISDLCAGLVGGLGLTPSCNIGEGGIALAEAVHGSAPDIAGKNLANPTALLLSGVMMLRHLKLHDKADQIHNAIIKTIAEGRYRTADLGGSSTTSEFTKAICDHL